MPTALKRRADASIDSPKSTKKSRVLVKEEVEVVTSSPRRSTRSKATAVLENSKTNGSFVEEVKEVHVPTPRKGKTTSKPVEKVTSAEATGETQETTTNPGPQKGKAKARSAKKTKKVGTEEGSVHKSTEKTAPPQDAIENREEALEEEGEKPKKRHRKTKEEKEAEMVPLAARTQNLKMFIGAHVSGAGGAFLSCLFLHTDLMFTLRCTQRCHKFIAHRR